MSRARRGPGAAIETGVRIAASGAGAAAIVACLLFAAGAGAGSAAPLAPQGPPPPLDEVRRTMGIPSHDDVRGQQDTIGFASRADQMARVWELSATPPAPESLGPAPAPGVVAILAPHDDHLYAGRVYRKVVPLVTAKTVVMIGVFHRYRRFGVQNRLVFDPYRIWSAPDGPIPVSPLRAEILARLPTEDVIVDAAMHDTEHSLETLAFWLKHRRADLEIVPIIVPVARFGRFEALADHLAAALGAAMKAYGWTLGRDVAIVISTDGIHYGPDFKQVTFGDGGIDAYSKAVARDRSLLLGPLRGQVTDAKARALFTTLVDPDHPDDYRWTWCGRFSVPFGMLLLERLARAQDATAIAHPIAYATSVGAPELPVRDVGLGATAPASLYHFVGYPAVAFDFKPRR